MENTKDVTQTSYITSIGKENTDLFLWDKVVKNTWFACILKDNLFNE